MSNRIGYVFNGALNKNIPVNLCTIGPSFWRPTGAISQVAKNLALAKVKAAFEGGDLFTDTDMRTTESLVIRYAAI